MSYYRELRRRDVFDWMDPLLRKGTFHVRRSDGKLEHGPMYEAYTTPWHHIRNAQGAKCPYLHRLCFEISPRTPAGQFVPRRCQRCWKVVIRPRTLKELFALEDLLVKLDLPSKCGIERRSYSPCSKNRYGGYIYNMSPQEGTDRLKVIRELVHNDPGLGEGVDVYLKRGCTEMEMAMGRSDEWKVTDIQNEVEDYLDWLVVMDVEESGQAKHVLNKVHMTWIEWAAEIGDETYLEYTGGKPIYDPPVKYELEVASPDDPGDPGEA